MGGIFDFLGDIGPGFVQGATTGLDAGVGLRQLRRRNRFEDDEEQRIRAAEAEARIRDEQDRQLRDQELGITRGVAPARARLDEFERPGLFDGTSLAEFMGNQGPADVLGERIGLANQQRSNLTSRPEFLENRPDIGGRARGQVGSLLDFDPGGPFAFQDVNASASARREASERESLLAGLELQGDEAVAARNVPTGDLRRIATERFEGEITPPTEEQRARLAQLRASTEATQALTANRLEESPRDPRMDARNARLAQAAEEIQRARTRALDNNAKTEFKVDVAAAMNSAAQRFGFESAAQVKGFLVEDTDRLFGFGEETAPTVDAPPEAGRRAQGPVGRRGLLAGPEAAAAEVATVEELLASIAGSNLPDDRKSLAQEIAQSEGLTESEKVELLTQLLGG